MSGTLRTLEMKEMCAAPGGNRWPDSLAVVSQHIPEQLPRTKDLGAGWGAHSRGVCCESVVTNEKVLKLLSDSLTTVIH